MHLPTSLTLRAGDAGEFVAELQRRLAAQDIYPEGEVSGTYDELTFNAVRTFQTANGLKDDGIAGPATLRRLNASDPQSGDDSSQNEDEQEEEKNTERLDTIDRLDELAAQEEAQRIAQQAAQEQEEFAQKAEPEEVNPFAGLATNNAVEQQRIAMLEEQQEQALTAEKETVAAPPPNPFAKPQAQEMQEQLHAAQERENAPPSPAAPSQEATAQAPETLKPAAETPPAPSNEELPTQQQAVEKAQPITNARLEEVRARVEAKLSPPTQEEVKQTGREMDAKGVKEAIMDDEKSISQTAGVGIAKQQETAAEIG